MSARTTAYARVADRDVEAAAQALGASALVTAADVRSPLRLPPRALVDLARRLARQSCGDVDAWLDGGLDGLMPGADVRRVLTARLVLRHVLKDLPPLLGALADAEGPVVVLGSGLSDGQLEAVARAAGTSVSVKAGRTGGTGLGPAAGGPRRPPRGAGGGLVVVCGSATDLAFLLPAARAARGRSVTVLLKNTRPDAVRAGEALRAEGAEVLSLDRLPGWSGSRDGRAARARLEAAQTADDRRTAVLRELDRALDLLHRVDGLLEARRPAVVLGALDRSPVGGALASSPGRAGLAVVDVQHGTFLPAGVLDLLRFDLVLAWNARSAQRLVDDGHRGALEVVGNPRWDELAGPVPPPTATASQLRSWKGGRQLLLHLPQPAKGPVLTPEVAAATEGVLAELLRARPDTCLLVKQRARTSGAVDGGPLAPLLAEGRVRVVEDEQLGLAQALPLADVAVSIYSTALVDALAAGVPAVSVDVAGVVPPLDLDFLGALPVCTTLDELVAQLDRLADGDRPARDPDLLPSFSDPYDERLAAALSPWLTRPAPPRTGRSSSSRAMRALAGWSSSRWPFTER